jgi:hypothetical protein
MTGSGTRFMAGLAIAGAVGLLLLATVLTWWSASHGPTGVGRQTMAAAGTLHLLTLASVWPWRRPFLRATSITLRVVVAAVALVWISMLFDTYSWVRSGIEPVSEYPGRRIESEFQQGVYGVVRIVDYATTQAGLPLLSLVGLVTVPSILSASAIFRSSRSGT